MAMVVGDRARFTVEIPWALWRAAKLKAIDDGCDLRDVVIAALERYLRREEAREACGTVRS